MPGDPYDSIQAEVAKLASPINAYSIMGLISGFGGANGKAYIDFSPTIPISIKVIQTQPVII